jgi:hypothetical protein
VDKGKINTRGDYLKAITGNFNLDAGGVQQSIGSNVDLHDQFYMAERWLTTDQLKAFEDCLKIENRVNGLEIHVRTWDNDSVTIVGDYQLSTGSGPPRGVAFRKNITIHGTKNDNEAKNKFPETLYPSNNFIVTLERNPKERFEFLASMSTPVDIRLPILAVDTCIVVNQKTGFSEIYYLSMSGGPTPSL